MKRILFSVCIAIAAASAAHAATGAKPATKTQSATSTTAKPVAAPRHDWQMTATVIEACSCPMFCTSFFAGTRTEGAAEHGCRFNAAIKVNQGHDHDVELDGARFWIAADLGADWSKGAPWAVVTFDRSLTEAQRSAISKIVAKLFPIRFQSLATDEADISWVLGPEAAHALVNNGRTAEVALAKTSFGQDGKTPVIEHLRYWGANRNDGFRLMTSTVAAYRSGTKPFASEGTSGFVLDFEIHGDDAAPIIGEKRGE